jgi:hypothetical protein
MRIEICNKYQTTCRGMDCDWKKTNTKENCPWYNFRVSVKSLHNPTLGRARNERNKDKNDASSKKL